MKRLILLLPVVLLWLFSCTSDEKLVVGKDVTFSISGISREGTNGGRNKSGVAPKSVLVTIKDNSGTIVADRKELMLYKFGDNFLSLPLTLKTNGMSRYRLTEFLVVDIDNEIAYVTPREGSAMAHLVADALDVEFTVSANTITTVVPEVLAVDENSGAASYGYGQFGFKEVKTIGTVFSAFIRGASNFELTNAHLKVQGLTDTTSQDTTTLWTYATELEAKANVLLLKEAAFYKITATKPGYKTLTETKVLISGSTIEMVLEKTEPDIYVAGYDGGRAIYWKNGVPVILGQSTNISSATSIYVADDDVYVTGATGELPLYWKNGEKNFLPVPSNSIRGQTNDVVVRDGEVHICGDYITSHHAQAAYWKNGVRTDLQIPSSFTNANTDQITIDGSDVYITGYVRTWHTTLLTAALWKNGQFIPLPVPENYSVSKAEGVRVADGHIYVSGYITTSPYPPDFHTSVRAVYWKDGVMQFIEQTNASSASGLDIEGSDVFIPYNINGKAHYWKNGQKVFVDEAAVTFTYELVVSNGVVYIAGTYKENSADRAVACYWVNEQRVLLQSEKESQAVSCFVVRRD